MEHIHYVLKNVNNIQIKSVQFIKLYLEVRKTIETGKWV